MQTIKVMIFIGLMISALMFVTYYILSWSILKVAILLLIGVFFVFGSIWGYKQMYHEKE